MTLPDVHLADEAVAAYVDGALSPSAGDRAERHLRGCPECRAVVGAQREAKVLIAAAPDPELPGSLLARLLDVPMTADLGGSDLVLAVDHGEFAWAPAGRTTAPEEPRLVDRSRVPAGGVSVPSGRRPTGAARPAGPSGPGRDRPERAASTGRSRRGRRGLAVSLAGLAFGVIASAASTTAPGSAAPARPGSVPGSSPTQLVVGGSAPMEASTIRFTRPTSQQGALVTTRSNGR